MRKMKDSGVEWIGKIPEGWQITKVGNLYDIVLGKMLSSKPVNDTDTLENYICATNIKWQGINTDTKKQMWFSEEEKEMYLLRDGDVLVMEGGMAGTSCIYKREMEPCYMQNSALRCRSKLSGDNRFIYYWMHAVYNTGYIDSICNKATIQHYTKDKISHTPMTVMPLKEQTRLVDYLDEKCSKIDSIIARQEEIIEKLKEYKLSIITEAVTKGLNSKAEMRNSGICEIGDVPKTCKITKLKYICNTQGRIGFKGYTTADLVDEGEGAYTLGASHMNNGKVDLSSPVYISWEKYYESPEIMVKKNDLLIVQRGSTIGKVAIVDKDYGELTINPSLVLINKITINSKYLLYALSARYIVNYIALIGTTTAIPMISQKQINELQVVLPSSDQQRMIVEYLDEKCSRLDKTINDRQRVIGKWSEYKKSLIYEVVTGKKEV